MGILNKIGEATSAASRNVNEKTKNMSDTSNLKKKDSVRGRKESWKYLLTLVKHTIKHLIKLMNLKPTVMISKQEKKKSRKCVLNFKQ